MITPELESLATQARIKELLEAIRKIDPLSLIKLTIEKDPASVASDWHDIWMDGNTGGWANAFGQSGAPGRN